MEKISNRAIISRLYSSAEQQLQAADYDHKNWSEWYQVVQGLTVPEKMVYIIVKLNQNVTSGGFANFYKNSYGIFSPEIIHALSEIKATETADIVSNTLSVVNPTGLLDDEYKAHIFDAKLSELQKKQLYLEDVKYDQLEGHENLEDLLGGYLSQ